jgi:hypothetical protein
MSSVKIINHSGKQILLMDFTNLDDYNLLDSLVNESIKIVQSSKNKKSVLALLDITNTSINRKVLSSFKKLSESNRLYIKFIAFVGLNSIWVIVFKIFLFRKPNHKVINKRNDAIEWLVKQ